MIIASDSGTILLLTWALQAASVPETLNERLYQNNYQPVHASITSAFTEATFSGYSNQTLARSTWGAPATVTGNAQSTYGATLTWTCGATTNTIYGYYVVGASSGTLVYAEAFDLPRALTNGATITLTPVFTLASRN